MEHVLAKLPDYVLDFLSPVERREIENHLRACAACRAALEREREPGRAVRQTMRAIPPPPQARLHELMTQLTPARIHPSRRGWFQPVAAAAVLLLLGIGLIGRQPTTISTMTATSTSTLASTATVAGTIRPTAVDLGMVRGTPFPTPLPVVSPSRTAAGLSLSQGNSPK